MSGELMPLALLMDELKSDDIQHRLNAMRRLVTIADALGPERTRDELLPFLVQACVDDEDEVLLALAEELGGFVALIGGPDHAAALLPPLETLASVEEAMVRQKAVDSLCQVALTLEDGKDFVGVLTRLGAGDWFTARTSACGLFATAVGLADEATNVELRQLFSALCKDQTPMVRRAASTHLGEYAKKLPTDVVKEAIVPMFKALAQDDQDSVRLLAVESCVAIGGMLDEDENKALILPIIRSSTQDKSWRVRYMVADQFTKLCDAIGLEITSSEMVPAFVHLLGDAEAEVRTAAASKVAGVCGVVSEEARMKSILPKVKKLSADTSQHVRASLASVIMDLAPIFGKEATSEHLLPLFLLLLEDDFPEVRLNIIAKLESVNKVIGVQKLTDNLLPAIMHLAEDGQWRVRLAIIEYIPLLAGQLGVEFFDDKLASLCMTWLADTVFSIRESATKNLMHLTEVFGKEWATKNVLPKVREMHKHQNYLYRMTTLFAITALGRVVGQETIVNGMLPLLKNLRDDPVPNIRFNVAKALTSLIPNLDSTGQASVQSLLEGLAEDKDVDVQYYAHQGLKLL